MRNATKTIPQILRENILTVFNLLNLAITVCLAVVGAWKNILFIFVIIINTAMGNFQEIKAKRRLEKLSLLAAPRVTVLRDGEETEIRPQDIQVGDIMRLSAGCAVCTDCTVKEGRVFVNEAVLSGESEPCVKVAGDRLISGSSITAGRCTAAADCTADECFVSKIARDVQKSKGCTLEMLTSMNRVTKLTTLFILPLGVLLFIQAYFFRGAGIDTAVVATSAGLLGMLPKGLVLLISIGLAVGVIRLSKKNVLVRDLQSLENLAHCDTVCLDKTGTLTTGELRVVSVSSETDDTEFCRLMATYLTNTEDNNSTFLALREYFTSDAPYPAVSSTPFCSERKWSSVTLADGRTLVIGAPEMLLCEVPQELCGIAADGMRVLSVGLCRGEVARGSVKAVGTIVIADSLRDNAKETVSYFYSQGVDVKIISGDSTAAAAAVAKRCGVKGTERCADTSEMSESELFDAAERCSVFGRVTPQQKKALIAAMKKNGHTVAMIGDGVNDLSAMRCADCSAAIGSGSDAAKQTAQLVLLDSDFAVLRDVIAEGRRVVNNLTRSAGVFFIKTAYSVLFCILCLLFNRDFPFIPIQITLIDALIEAFPAFFMSFESRDEKISQSFLKSASLAAAPNTLAIFLCAMAAFALSPRLGIGAAQTNLVLYIAVGIISLAGVIKASLPMTMRRALICAASALGFIGAVTLFAPLLSLPALTRPASALLAATVIPATFLSVFLNIRPRRFSRESV